MTVMKILVIWQREHPASRMCFVHIIPSRKHKVVVWSVQETKQFYEVGFDLKGLMGSVFAASEPISS